jgi:hypothetical protein
MQPSYPPANKFLPITLPKAMLLRGFPVDITGPLSYPVK